MLSLLLLTATRAVRHSTRSHSGLHIFRMAMRSPPALAMRSTTAEPWLTTNTARRPAQMFLDSAVSTMVTGGMMAVPASGSSRPPTGGYHAVNDRTVRTQAELLLMSPLPVLTQVLRQQIVRGAQLSAEAAGNLLDLSMSDSMSEDGSMSDDSSGYAAMEVQDALSQGMVSPTDEAGEGSTVVALMAAAALMHLRGH